MQRKEVITSLINLPSHRLTLKNLISLVHDKYFSKTVNKINNISSYRALESEGLMFFF